MSIKVRKTLIRVLLALLGLMVLFVLLVIIFFPRPDLPPIITEDFCARNNIHFDTASLERIDLDPESILVDPESFLKEDLAYLLLAEHRARVFDPFPFDAWAKDIEKLASQPERWSLFQNRGICKWAGTDSPRMDQTRSRNGATYIIWYQDNGFKKIQVRTFLTF